MFANLGSGEITADSDTLMRQAPMTVSLYAAHLRKEFGDAWCDANPDAFATMVQAASIDFVGSLIGREIGRLRKAIEDAAPYLDRGSDE